MSGDPRPRLRWWSVAWGSGCRRPRRKRKRSVDGRCGTDGEADRLLPSTKRGNRPPSRQGLIHCERRRAWPGWSMWIPDRVVDGRPVRRTTGRMEGTRNCRTCAGCPRKKALDSPDGPRKVWSDDTASEAEAALLRLHNRRLTNEHKASGGRSAILSRSQRLGVIGRESCDGMRASVPMR